MYIVNSIQYIHSLSLCRTFHTAEDTEVSERDKEEDRQWKKQNRTNTCQLVTTAAKKRQSKGERECGRNVATL